MKVKCIFVYTMILWSLSVSAQGLYDLEQIQEIKIYFAGNNWDAQLDSLKSKDPNGRILASYVLLNGQRFDSVGVRYKGNSTYNPTRVKNPLNLKLDYVKSAQRYQSFNTLKLSNAFMDPSFLREVLGYFICRQYLPASRANFMKVYINDVYIGLYTNVEHTGSDFLSYHFGSTGGAYFQCDRPDVNSTLPSSCPPGNPGSALRYPTADSACYFNSYEKESDFGWAEFLNMMRILNQDQTNISEVLNVDRVLWMLALNNVFVNLDSYSGSGHNYLMYESDDKRFQPIMWDLNEFYGAFVNAGTMGQLTVQQMRELDPLLHINNPDRPLISKILLNSSYQKRYLAHIKTILDDIQSKQSYEGLGIQLQNLIRTAVQQDKNKFFTDAAFEQNLKNDFSNSGGPNGGKTYPGLIKFTNERKNFLERHNSILPAGPVISDVTHFPAKISNHEPLRINAKIQNANQAFLYFRTNAFSEFQFVEMKDDGKSDDGASNDGVYGVSISLGAPTLLQYYIYSENNQMASLSPARAAYEFYQVQPQMNLVEKGAVLINELVASNQTGVVDEQGDFEDWIELYNTTDRDIHMKGLYLSDNPDNALKYAFPDTAIKAKSFLIVWADEDGKDPGLHANFKLSKSGERLKLYNSDSSLISELDFPELQEDESYGLCNGMGQVFAKPSFNAPNLCPLSVADALDEKGWSVYPNPNSGICIMEWKDQWKGVIEIRTTQGILVQTFQIQTEGNEKWYLNLQELPDGMYMVQMLRSDKVHTRWLVIVR